MTSKIDSLKNDIEDTLSELLGLRVTCADFVVNERWEKWWTKVTMQLVLADNFAILFSDMDGEKKKTERK